MKKKCYIGLVSWVCDPPLSGHKLIHVPIDVPVPDEVVVKIIQEEDND